MLYIILPKWERTSRVLHSACSGDHPGQFVFPAGSGSGAYCSFLFTCTWWNGGTRPSRSFHAEGWGRSHLCVALMCLKLSAFTASSRLQSDAQLLLLLLLSLIAAYHTCSCLRTQADWLPKEHEVSKRQKLRHISSGGRATCKNQGAMEI